MENSRYGLRTIKLLSIVIISMKCNRTLNLVIAILFILAWYAVLIVIGIRVYPSLPDIIPDHFGPDGTPDSYGSKDGDYLLFYGLTFGVSLFIILLSIVIVKIPVQFVNIPSKDFFRNHPDAYKAVITKVQVWMFWLAGITTQLMVTIFIISLQDSKAGNANGSPIWIPLVIFAIQISILLVVLFIICKIPPSIELEPVEE